jgi:phospholipid transport system substrate-binding protein
VKEFSIRRTAACVLVALLISLGAAAEASKTGSQVIDALHDALLDVMKRATELGYDGRAEKLAPLVPEYFDVPFMARKSVGRYWKELSEADQRRFLETFTRFMIANYAGQFDGYSGQSFETLGEEPARMETVVVKSRLVDPNGDDVELNYRMRQVSGKWKIVDVYLDGTVSELALRRSEFSSIVKREGFEALIVAIDAKITKLASGSEAS